VLLKGLARSTTTSLDRSSGYLHRKQRIALVAGRVFDDQLEMLAARIEAGK
jgi:hypothetical protein